MMTSQQLTIVNRSGSSSVPCSVIEVGLQNKMQSAPHDHEKMCLRYLSFDGKMDCLAYGALSRWIRKCNIMITFKRLVAHLNHIQMQYKTWQKLLAFIIEHFGAPSNVEPWILVFTIIS